MRLILPQSLRSATSRPVPSRAFRSHVAAAHGCLDCSGGRERDVTAPDVVVVGAGLIGTATAWRLAEAGLSVTMVVGERSAAASRVAAGMLAPVTETTFTERTLLALNQASSRRWPTFAAEVVEASGRPSGLRTNATLSVA